MGVTGSAAYKLSVSWEERYILKPSTILVTEVKISLILIFRTEIVGLLRICVDMHRCPCIVVTCTVIFQSAHTPNDWGKKNGIFVFCWWLRHFFIFLTLLFVKECKVICYCGLHGKRSYTIWIWMFSEPKNKKFNVLRLLSQFYFCFSWLSIWRVVCTLKSFLTSLKWLLNPFLSST